MKSRFYFGLMEKIQSWEEALHELMHKGEQPEMREIKSWRFRYLSHVPACVHIGRHKTT